VSIKGVKNADLGNNSIGSGKVTDDILTGADVRDLTGADITDGSLGGAELANFGVTSEKLATGAVTRAKLGFKAVDQNAMGDDSGRGRRDRQQLDSGRGRQCRTRLEARTSPAVPSEPRSSMTSSRGGRRSKLPAARSMGTARLVNAGDQIIFGGSRAIPGPFVRILDSHRDGNGWSVTVRNETFRDNVVSLETYAYCLVP